MNITAVIVGVNEWERFTLPCIQSIRACDPDLSLVVVDNGSDPPYPPGYNAFPLLKTACYASALNYGMACAEEPDWYVLLNNDILFHKPITDRFDSLDAGTLYGFQYFHRPAAFPFCDYLASWGLFLSAQMARGVGEFDDALTPMYFEDADYCIRAVRAGFQIKLLDWQDWGIEHLGRVGEREDYMHKHMRAREKNRAYLKGKHGF